MELINKEPARYHGKIVKIRGYMTAEAERLSIWSISEYATANEKLLYYACMNNQPAPTVDSGEHELEIAHVDELISLPERELLWQQSVEVCGRVAYQKNSLYSRVSLDLMGVKCFPDPTELR